eukprot:755911-Hanusia_phi.AAC.1
MFPVTVHVQVAQPGSEAQFTVGPGETCLPAGRGEKFNDSSDDPKFRFKRLPERHLDSQTPLQYSSS